MRGFPLAFTLAALVAVLAAPSYLAARQLDAAATFDKSEAAIGRMLSDHRLTGANGLPLEMGAFRGRPLVVSLVYTACSAICPATTQQLRSAVEEARRAVGGEAFQVLTVGFDARNDTPARMSAFAVDQNVAADPLWRIASATPATLDRLLEEVGFSYSAAAGGFEHIVQTTIVDAEGRVYRQVYGDDFPIQVFVEPLKELVFGVTTRSLSPAGLADRLRFLCTVYDPATGRYRTDYGIYFGIVTGGLSLLVMGFIVIRMLLGNRRLERAAADRTS
jgi:protein SCO1/2